MNRAWCALLALALAGVGCSHEIGDSCKTSVDCDPNGTRACDISQPAGYCTILGCDETLCPGGSTCIRLFPETFLEAANADGGKCDPKTEDVPQADGAVENKCLADEVCLDSGLCAKQTSEQRYCAKACSSNKDCRSGYDCRHAGEMGSMVLATNPLATTSFCAPHVTPVDGGP